MITCRECNGPLEYVGAGKFEHVNWCGRHRPVVQVLESFQDSDEKFMIIKSLLVDLLEQHRRAGAASVGLLAYSLHVDSASVEKALTELRQEGVLILDNERGYFLAESVEQYRAWRDRKLVPQMLEQVKTLAAMQAAARALFDVDDRVVLESLTVQEGKDDGGK